MGTEPVDRQARRRAQTREKLLGAARAVFARQGIEAARINEITDEADVGFGSFYNHFESKDAIGAAVVEGLVRDLGAATDAASSGLEDPAEVIAIGHRVVVREAQADPQLGRLLVHLELSHRTASAALAAYAVRDIERGRASGRFAVDDVAFALASTGGALLGCVRALVDGDLAEGADERHAAAVLRVLGLPADEAKAIAARPLPPLER